jgi:hypothetical protein
MKEKYSKPKMRPGDWITALQDFEDAKAEMLDAIYQEFAPPLIRICDAITKTLECLNGGLPYRKQGKPEAK